MRHNPGGGLCGGRCGGNPVDADNRPRVDDPHRGVSPLREAPPVRCTTPLLRPPPPSTTSPRSSTTPVHVRFRSPGGGGGVGVPVGHVVPLPLIIYIAGCTPHHGRRFGSLRRRCVLRVRLEELEEDVRRDGWGDERSCRLLLPLLSSSPPSSSPSVCRVRRGVPSTAARREDPRARGDDTARGGGPKDDRTARPAAPQREERHALLPAGNPTTVAVPSLPSRSPSPSPSPPLAATTPFLPPPFPPPPSAAAPHLACCATTLLNPDTAGRRRRHRHHHPTLRS